MELETILRRLKPEKIGALRRRPDRELTFFEDAGFPFGSVMFDTNVYIDAIKGKAPTALRDSVEHARGYIFHSAVVIAELANRLGGRTPTTDIEINAFAQLRGLIEDIEEHTIRTPTSIHWTEAGIVAGARAKAGNFQPKQSLSPLNDALLAVQARALGATLITHNVNDFDVLAQIIPDLRVMFYKRV